MLLLLFILFFIISVLFHFFIKDTYFYNQKKKCLLFILKNPQTPPGDLNYPFVPPTQTRLTTCHLGSASLGTADGLGPWITAAHRGPAVAQGGPERKTEALPRALSDAFSCLDWEPQSTSWGRGRYISEAWSWKRAAEAIRVSLGPGIWMTRWTFVGKGMSLLFNMLSRLVTAFLPRSKHLLISWLQSPSKVIFEHKKIKSVITVSIVSHLFAMKSWDPMS